MTIESFFKELIENHFGSAEMKGALLAKDKEGFRYWIENDLGNFWEFSLRAKPAKGGNGPNMDTKEFGASNSFKVDVNSKDEEYWLTLESQVAEWFISEREIMDREIETWANKS